MTTDLTSVGLDVGTTTTSLIVSRLTVRDRASAFAVPDLQILDRQILYQSPIHMTPLLQGELIDGPALRQIVEQEYRSAGIRREDVDTGAVIITGETSRKENARSVVEALSDYAGEFVVATAGPDLESALAARGSGAVEWSARTGTPVLHMDIGGGTSNLAWIHDGRITATSCLDVGGRLLRFDRSGTVTWISPSLSGLTELRPGDRPALPQLEALTEMLTQTLEMAAGLRPATDLLRRLTTATTLPSSEGRMPAKEAGGASSIPLISFSGGVAECIRQELPPMAFGDIGPLLGKAIRRSRLCESYRLGDQTIRATVIGAGCHSAQLSGSTVFHRGISFPLKDLPILPLDPESPDLQAQIRQGMGSYDKPPVLALPGWPGDYRQIAALADLLAAAIPTGPILVTVEQDMAKALGQALALRLSPDRPILCLDRLHLTSQSYLDVAAPIGPALPVIIKTLIFSPSEDHSHPL